MTGAAANDDDIARLFAALTWEANRSSGRLAIPSSLLVHVAALLAIYLAGPATRHAVVIPHLPDISIFVPKPAPPREQVKPRESAVIKAGMPPPEGPKDQWTIQLSQGQGQTQIAFSSDSHDELQKVARKLGATLAILSKDPEDWDHAQFLFEPPDWKLVPGPKNISNKYLIVMQPARDWPIFQALALENHIDLDAYRGGALFDDTYLGCLEDAIRTNAQDHNKPFGKVISARLEFTLASPCGLVAVEVEIASNTAH